MLGGNLPAPERPSPDNSRQRGLARGCEPGGCGNLLGAAVPKQGLRVVSTTRGMACALGRVGLACVGLDWAGRRWVGAGKRLAWSGVLGGGRVGRGWVRIYEANLNDRQPIFGAYRPRKGESGQIPMQWPLLSCLTYSVWSSLDWRVCCGVHWVAGRWARFDLRFFASILSVSIELGGIYWTVRSQIAFRLAVIPRIRSCPPLPEGTGDYTREGKSGGHE